MALPELTRRIVEEQLSQWCRRMNQAGAATGARVGYSIDDNTVTLHEERPASPPSETAVQVAVAQFRYAPEQGLWRLYWLDRLGAWQEYDELPHSKDFGTLLGELGEDPVSIVWD